MSQLIKEVKETAEDLSYFYPDLKKSEALQIAVQIQKNRVLMECFGVTDSDNSPKYLEAIAMALGYKEGNIVSELADIAASLESINLKNS